VRIDLVQQVAATRPDLVLETGAVREVRKEDLPDTGRDELAHRVYAAVPAVDVSDDAHALRIRSPDREVHTGGVSDLHPTCAKLFPRAVVRPLVQQVQVELAEHLSELVGIVHLERDPAFRDAEAVIERIRIAVERDDGLEEPVAMPS